MVGHSPAVGIGAGQRENRVDRPPGTRRPDVGRFPSETSRRALHGRRSAGPIEENGVGRVERGALAERSGDIPAFQEVAGARQRIGCGGVGLGDVGGRFEVEGERGRREEHREGGQGGRNAPSHPRLTDAALSGSSRPKHFW